MFSLFAFSLSLWLFGYVMMYFSKEPSQALFWARIGFIGITFIPIFAYHFIITFLEKPVPRWLLVLIYSSVIPGVILSQSNFVYNGIGKYFWGFYPTAGPLYFIFLGMFAFLFSYGVLLLSLGIIEAERVKEYGRSQKIKYVFVAFLGGTTGIVDYIIKYKIPIYPFGYLAALFFITIIAIAIIKEHLFDIDLAAYYVFTWLMSLGTAAGVFLISFLLAFIFPLDLFIKALLLVISSTALAALFPWYFSKYEDWSNKHILHGKYDYLKIMPQKATDWLKHLDLGELIKAVTNDFKGVMGFEDVKIFLYGDYAIGSHEAARNCYFINPDNLDDEGVFNISKETALVKFAEAQNRPIYLNDLNKEIQSKGVRRSVRRAGEQVNGVMM
jgi:hypothetical protein